MMRETTVNDIKAKLRGLRNVLVETIISLKNLFPVYSNSWGFLVYI